MKTHLHPTRCMAVRSFQLSSFALILLGLQTSLLIGCAQDKKKIPAPNPLPSLVPPGSQSGGDSAGTSGETPAPVVETPAAPDNTVTPPGPPLTPDSPPELWAEITGPVTFSDTPLDPTVDPRIDPNLVPSERYASDAPLTVINPPALINWTKSIELVAPLTEWIVDATPFGIGAHPQPWPNPWPTEWRQAFGKRSNPLLFYRGHSYQWLGSTLYETQTRRLVQHLPVINDVSCTWTHGSLPHTSLTLFGLHSLYNTPRQISKHTQGLTSQAVSFQLRSPSQGESLSQVLCQLPVGRDNLTVEELEATFGGSLQFITPGAAITTTQPTLPLRWDPSSKAHSTQPHFPVAPLSVSSTPSRLPPTLEISEGFHTTLQNRAYGKLAVTFRPGTILKSNPDLTFQLDLCKRELNPREWDDSDEVPLCRISEIGIESPGLLTPSGQQAFQEIVRHSRPGFDKDDTDETFLKRSQELKLISHLKQARFAKLSFGDPRGIKRGEGLYLPLAQAYRVQVVKARPTQRRPDLIETTISFNRINLTKQDEKTLSTFFVKIYTLKETAFSPYLSGRDLESLFGPENTRLMVYHYQLSGKALEENFRKLPSSPL